MLRLSVRARRPFVIIRVHDTIDMTNSVIAVSQMTASAFSSIWVKPSVLLAKLASQSQNILHIKEAVLLTHQELRGADSALGVRGP